MRPQDYVTQDGCWNCQHLCINENFVSPMACNVDKDEPEDEDYEKYEEWMIENAVDGFGKCSKHFMRKE